MRNLALAVGVLAAVLGSGACATSEFNEKGSSREKTVSNGSASGSNGGTSGGAVGGTAGGAVGGTVGGTVGGSESGTSTEESSFEEGGASSSDSLSSVDDFLMGDESDAGVLNPETEDFGGIAGETEVGAEDGTGISASTAEAGSTPVVSEGDGVEGLAHLGLRLSTGLQAAYRRDASIEFEVPGLGAETLAAAEQCLVEGDGCSACDWTSFSVTKSVELLDGPRTYRFAARLRAPTGEFLTDCATVEVQGIDLRLVRGDSLEDDAGDLEGFLVGTRLVTGESLCVPGLSVTDSLGFYSWKCREDEGFAVFRPQFQPSRGIDWESALSSVRGASIEVELALDSLVLGTSAEGF